RAARVGVLSALPQIVPNLGILKNLASRSRERRAFFTWFGALPKLGTIRGARERAPQPRARRIAFISPRERPTASAPANPLYSPAVRVAVGIMAHDEGANVAAAIRSILGQRGPHV